MVRHWRCRDFGWNCSERTRIMGVINVTPDSFSDGGENFESQKAIARAYAMINDGADIIDVGGESSRPGSQPVSVEEELRRVLPVIKELTEHSTTPVSIDTVKYEVAQQAMDAGAVILNDISGLQHQPRLANLAARYQAALVIMHMRGNPQTMQSHVDYQDLMGDIRTFFQTQVQIAQNAGVDANAIALDPGIGFSKTAEQNVELLQRLPEFADLDFPLLVGVSRKSFLGKITGKEAQQRIYATAAAVTACILNGASIVRVHDVAEMHDVVRVADAIRLGNQSAPLTRENISNPCG